MNKNLFKISLPYLALIAANAIWGSTFVVGKITLESFPPMSLSFIRFSLACILIAPFFFTQPNKKKIKVKDWPRLFGVGLGLVTFNIGLFYQGLQMTTAINAALLTLVIPGMSVFFGWLFFREKIYWINIVGSFIGLIGSIILIGLPLLYFGNFPPNTLVGNSLILLSDVAFVVGSILSKQLLKTYSKLTITSIAFFIGFLTFLVPAVNDYMQNPHWMDNITIWGVLGLLFLVIMASICGYFLYEWGLERVGLLKANMFQYLEPVVATALAIPILRDSERISFSFIIGTLLIILGVYWGTLGKKEEHHYQHRSHRI